MNSWHSFSPNGRWLVFSSKSRSPYTQMFLTHLDEQGNDSPAILIENATAANRAVNIPEFVNIPPDGLVRIDVPAAEFYRLFDRAGTGGERPISRRPSPSGRRPWNSIPAMPRPQANLGVALAETGSLDEAITHYQKAVDLKPEYAKGHNNLALALLQKGRTDDAVAQLEKALEIDPGYDEAHNNLGRVLAESGKTDEAILHWQKAIEVNPSLAEAHNNLGRALAERDRLDEAAAHLEKALALNPKYPEALNSMGVILASKGKMEAAIANWQKALAIDPNFGQALCNLGNAMFMQGKIPEALARWRKGLSLEPNALAVLNQAAWVLATNPDAAIRNGAEAVQFAERAVQLSGAQVPALLGTLGSRLRRSRPVSGCDSGGSPRLYRRHTERRPKPGGRHEGDDLALRKEHTLPGDSTAMNSGPRSIVLLVAMAALPARSQQLDLAQLYADAKKAYADRNFALAAQKYEAILRERPDVAEAWADLGNAYFQQNRRDRASTAYRKAVQLKPELAGPISSWE